jgi:glycosyltransferase involved in cell wall biosynthesis
MSLSVVVDATTWAPGRTGVGLYTERVLTRWLSDFAQDQLWLATNAHPEEALAVTRQLGHGQVIGPPFPIRAAWMQSLLPAQLARIRPEFAFFPNYLAPLLPVPGVRNVLTVHDMAVFLYPETFTFKKRVLQRHALPTLVRQAAAIVTPSEATRRDLLRIIPTDPDKVVVTPLAAPDGLGQPLDPVLRQELVQQLQLPERYVLAVGTLEPRKNLVRLIEAFEQVANQFPDVHLLVAGGKGWRDDEIQAAMGHTPLRDRLRQVGYVSPTALQVLYESATLLAYPSLYEGFGLPVVEAMACGCPVLTSRGSSLDEAAGGAALAVDPLSVTELANGLQQLLQSADLREELAGRGRLRHAQLSWRETAAQTREVFVRLQRGQKPRG